MWRVRISALANGDEIDVTDTISNLHVCFESIPGESSDELPDGSALCMPVSAYGEPIPTVPDSICIEEAVIAPTDGSVADSAVIDGDELPVSQRIYRKAPIFESRTAVMIIEPVQDEL